MNKNKSFYLTLVVIFCVVLAGFGGFIIGTYFGSKCESTKIVDTKNETKKEEVNDDDAPVAELTENVKRALYSYIKNGEGNFSKYFNNLTNSQKLYIAGIEDGASLSELKNNLIKYFGSNLNLLGENYYANNTLQATYDSSKDKYTWSGDADLLFDFENSGIYDYRLESTEIKGDELIITYYGLFSNSDGVGPMLVTNDNNIRRYLGVEELDENITDEEYLENAFNNNKDDFFIFTYIYKSVNDKYVLVDFKLEK